MYNGIINIKKEKEYTSHDVVAKLRGILKQKKIGHTGTLDPDATGVLPVCLGSGTKLCDMLTDRSKEYEAVLLLGQTTDTEDTSGTILTQTEVKVSEDEVRSVISSFVGSYEQIPPMYSARKVNGRKLYELAREGKVIERQPSTVTILTLTIQKIELPRVTIAVACSKGTYIRSLCRDIGEKLGTGGCMEELTRTRVGEFCLSDSLTLSEVEQLRDQEKLLPVIKPVDLVFESSPAVHIQEEFCKLIYNGNPFYPEHIQEMAQDLYKQESVRVYDSNGRFIGLYQYQREKERFAPLKMFL